MFGARTYGGGAADELPARGTLGARLKKLVQSGRVEMVSSFRTGSLARTTDARLVLTSGDQQVVVDTVVNPTGFRPDHDMVGELRLDRGTVPPHGVDELTHPEPGYYAVGARSYGRAPTFLLATGYEQARSVVAALSGLQDYLQICC